MIACNTDGTFVIVSSIFMVMRNGHHRGKKEEQYEKNSKVFVAAHGFFLYLVVDCYLQSYCDAMLNSLGILQLWIS